MQIYTIILILQNVIVFIIMSRDKIKFYDDKFLKPKYDFHGIKLIPDLYGIDESDYRIIWDIYNPNDISYSVEALKTIPTTRYVGTRNLILTKNPISNKGGV